MDERVVVEDPEAPEPERAKTRAAFDRLRAWIGGPRAPNATSVRLEGEYAAMPADEAASWIDGPPVVPETPIPGRLPPELADMARLWVVTEDDVLHAGRRCAFGLSRPRSELKHTNLTGGAPAYAGGELMILDEGTVVVNGDSGRYGPRSGNEMRAVLKAFADSGYRTLTTGWDEDTGKPAPLIGYRLEQAV